MKPRAVQVLLKRCLGHQPGESALVVADSPTEAYAREFLRQAQALGVEASLFTIPLRQSAAEEPPRAVAEALKASPVAVLLTTRSLAQTAARREASEKHGTRIASLSGADPERLDALLDLDYDDLRARTEELAALLDGARRVRLISPAGTDISFEIRGRPVLRDVGDLT